MPRCFWCNDDPLYIAYHDDEWGVPLRDAERLFELLATPRANCSTGSSPGCFAGWRLAHHVIQQV
jgi:hypothetical protein